MSKRSKTQKQRACGKKRFRSKQEALRTLQRVTPHAGQQAVPVRTYACDHCKGWHLTSQGRAR